MRRHFRVAAAAAVLLLVAVLGTVTAHADTGLGSLTGHITLADDSPAVDAQVQGYEPNTGDNFFATTDAAGEYTAIDLNPGAYIVSVSYGPRFQYFHQEVDFGTADPITIEADATTVADEQLLPTGTVQVTATDDSNGQPLNDFCAFVANGAGSWYDCANGTGLVTLVDVVAVPSSVEVSQAGYQDSRQSDVPINSGLNSISVPLTPAALISAMVIDKKTGAPVTDACLSVRPRAYVNLGNPFVRSGCTDPSGQVVIDGLPGGSYDLFAEPFDGVHGWQWVGTTGGVGREEKAHSVLAIEGQTVVAPTVRLDKAGSVAGTITDAATGQPIPGACVSALPISVDPSGEPGPRACADENGHYQLDGLGPYYWPLETSVPSFGSDAVYAWQWGNGSANRFSASAVKLTAGRVATFSPTMVHGGVITGVVLDNAGHPLADENIYVTNATTGDMAVGWVRTDATGHFTFSAVLGQSIRIGNGTNNWYAKKSSWTTATKVTVTNGATKTITIKYL